jgi:hypothetical protein
MGEWVTRSTISAPQANDFHQSVQDCTQKNSLVFSQDQLLLKVETRLHSSRHNSLNNTWRGRSRTPDGQRGRDGGRHRRRRHGPANRFPDRRPPREAGVAASPRSRSTGAGSA